MAPFNVRSKLCIAPIHVRSKVCQFAPHMDGSNADFALHMEGRHADFAPHIKQRHSVRDQIIAKAEIFANFRRELSKTSNILGVYLTTIYVEVRRSYITLQHSALQNFTYCVTWD